MCIVHTWHLVKLLPFGNYTKSVYLSTANVISSLIKTCDQFGFALPSPWALIVIQFFGTFFPRTINLDCPNIHSVHCRCTISTKSPIRWANIIFIGWKFAFAFNVYELYIFRISVCWLKDLLDVKSFPLALVVALVKWTEMVWDHEP